MNPSRVPIARELFVQWQRARGTRTEAGLRPFSRVWEDLLEDARLVSAIERAEAENDAKTLATDGWVELKLVRYKSHLIDRILIPLDAEARWREAFGFVPPSNEEARQIQQFQWHPHMEFVRDARLNLSFLELRQLHDFLNDCVHDRDIVPIKERSLQIFDDEKRLDALQTSALFRPGRLDLRAHLRCENIGVPLAWKRGPAAASAQPVIVIENAATWHSYCRWNEAVIGFSAVIYGDGNRFADGARYLPDIFAELGGVRRILYFGDLDPQGLLIPNEASVRALASGLPIVEPHLWSYRQLLTLGAGRGQPWEGEPPPDCVCDWLQDLAGQVRQLFASGQRLAQEHIGWKFLQIRTDTEGKTFF